MTSLCTCHVMQAHAIGMGYELAASAAPTSAADSQWEVQPARRTAQDGFVGVPRAAGSMEALQATQADITLHLVQAALTRAVLTESNCTPVVGPDRRARHPAVLTASCMQSTCIPCIA